MYYLTGLPVEVTAAMDYPWAALLIIMFATANHHLEEREKRQRQQKRPATPLTPQQNLRAAMGLARDWFSTGAATSTVAAPTAVAATATVPATSTAAKRQKRSPEDELIWGSMVRTVPSVAIRNLERKVTTTFHPFATILTGRTTKLDSKLSIFVCLHKRAALLAMQIYSSNTTLPVGRCI